MSNYQISSKLSIFGVDFSGAKDACKKIWICKSTKNDNILQIEDCYRLRDELRKGSKRDHCFAALKNFIQREKSAAFGLDFPFGLPQTLLNGVDWETFIKQFPKMYEDPEQFRFICLQKSLKETGSKELKRQTDYEKKSPLCAYNLRIYKQTYYGICNILYPLVRDNSVCILPMQNFVEDKNLVIEICPSSTLRQEGLLFSGYKGKKDWETKRQNREKILDCIVKKGLIKDVSSKIREIVLNDTEGDALDSIIAAIATFRTIDKLYHPGLVFDIYKEEGYIYS